MAKQTQLIIVGLLAFAACEALHAEKPNIVFILADDVGIEPLGCYGGTSFETPNIDRLAESGVRFRHCYSMPVCHPTRVCFLTGRYPRHIGNPAWGTFPNELESQTVANVMRQAGYATAVAGKWQLALLAQDVQHPHRLGFDEYCLFGWHEGARYHDPLIWQNGTKREDTAGQYGPHLYTKFLIDFIQRNRAKPFFAFYSMALCHDVTDDLDKPVAYVPGTDRYLNYGEMVASMDQCVGRIVTAVEELGLQRKTLVLFSGDNGTARRSTIRAQLTDGESKKWTYVRDPVFCNINGQRIPGGKGSLTDGGTRVPLLASWLGTIESGGTVDDLVDFSDFLPTFADLSGGAVPPGVKLDGISMAARLTETGRGARQWAYAESKDRFWVRTQQWKLLNTGEFFDVASDPRESNDLAEADLPAEAKAVKQRLKEARATLDQPRAAGQTVRVAAISLLPKKFDLAGNANRLEEAFRDAQQGGAKIAVAPEGVLDGYVVNEIIAGEASETEMNGVAVKIDDPVIDRFRRLANELNMCLVFGFAERVGDDVFNCAVFIDHTGRICGKYHKMQFAEGYHPSWWFNRLGAQSRAFDTPYGRCGLMICNDRWNPSLARIPVLDGARYLIIPAFGSRSDAQDEAVQGRATENDVPVIEANVGVTLIVDRGKSVTVERREETVTFADITIPAPIASNPSQRDRVEEEFFRWRKTEMQRRYVKTMERLKRPDAQRR